MATEQIIGSITLEAGSDLSATPHRFVKVASDGQIDLATLDAVAEGVLMDKPAAAGRAARVQISGIAKVEAGAAVTRGGQVVADANGKAIDIGANTNPRGVALDAASAAGEIIRVLLSV